MSESRFDVINKKTGQRVLKNVTREDVLKMLEISQRTFYAVLSEEKRLCRRVYQIVPHYPNKNRLTVMSNEFPDQWRAMQRLFGLDPDEVARRREEEMMASRRCETCEYYAEYKGEMQCWNRDSDFMYQATDPDFHCIQYDERDNEVEE